MEKVDMYNDEFEIAGYEWMDYCEVQEEGEYNMLSSQARQETGLEKATYFKIIKNYDKLAEFFNKGV